MNKGGGHMPTAFVHIAMYILVLLEVCGVAGLERGPLFREIILEEDGLDRAYLGTDTAINAFSRIDVVNLIIIV
jgi:hypothetical protein